MKRDSGMQNVGMSNTQPDPVSKFLSAGIWVEEQLGIRMQT